MGKYTDEERLWHKLNKQFVKGVVDYGLIEDNDRILIGLSGGKDSLALLELLAARAKIYKPKFSVVAVHIIMTNIPYSCDLNYLKDFAESRGVEFVTYETGFDASTDNRKSPCFLCSWNRRKALFTIAKEYNCNKIALGHHKDDILETLLMNQVFQGAFSTMPPKLIMRKFDMTIIRPMCLIDEKDLITLSENHQYRKLHKNCPYEQQSHRSSMKDILKEFEKMNPDFRYSLWNSMTNIQEDMLPDKINK